MLLRARKASRAPLTLWPPFTLQAGTSHDADRDSYTAAAQRVLRGAGELPAGS